MTTRTFFDRGTFDLISDTLDECLENNTRIIVRIGPVHYYVDFIDSDKVHLIKTSAIYTGTLKEVDKIEFLPDDEDKLVIMADDTHKMKLILDEIKRNNTGSYVCFVEIKMPYIVRKTLPNTLFMHIKKPIGSFPRSHETGVMYEYIEGLYRVKEKK